MAVHPYLAVEGAIGVGKTTLARILGEALPAQTLMEVFEENPFLSDFYADRARYAFQTQIFFLLSRYRQQHNVIAEALRQSALVSDYLFAKDWLFAHLNLEGNELAMYERVHAILGEQIPSPTLVVYLKASTDMLMRRIAFRDRSYERQMSRDYISALRQAYETFFAGYTAAPVLALDTDDMDFVHDARARSEVIGRVKTALHAGSRQLRLLEMGPEGGEEPVALDSAPRLGDVQRFHRARYREQAAPADPYFDYMRLAQETGELARILAQAWLKQEQLLTRLGNRPEAAAQALETAGADLQERLAAVLGHLLTLANDAGIDLEAAFLQRMNRNPKSAMWPNDPEQT